MSDLQPEIPQEVEHVLDDPQRLRRRLLGGQEQQVDVAEWRQHAAAVAAGRGDAQVLGESQVGSGWCMLEQRRDDAVDQRAQQPGGLQAGYLFVLEGMLHVGLDAGQMAPEGAERRLSGNGAALLGDASEGVRKQGRRGFRGPRQGDGS